MILELRHQKVIDKISEEVCKYFDVSEQDIVNKDKKEKPSNARYFLWYILHYEMRLSVRMIADTYIRAERNVYKGISKIRCGLRTQSYYRTIYNELLNRIHPLIPKDWEREIEKIYGSAGEEYPYRKA